MAEEQRKTFEQDLRSMVERIDKRSFRKLQMEMHSCAIDCCKRDELSIAELQNCFQTCSKPVEQAQEYINQSLSNIQARIQRCAQNCADEISDKSNVYSNHNNDSDLTKQYDNCAADCFRKMIASIPNIEERIKDQFEGSRRF